MSGSLAVCSAAACFALLDGDGFTGRGCSDLALALVGATAFGTCCIDASVALALAVGAATFCDVGVALCASLAAVSCGGGDIGIAVLLLVLELEAAVVSLYPGGGSLGSLGLKSTLAIGAAGAGGGGGGGGGTCCCCCWCC